MCDGAWIVFGKAGGPETLSYDDALKEALCFGWIDGQIKRIDDTKYVRKFTPRRKKSVWSQRNKKIAAQLIKQGRMMPPGYEAIERAKKEGMWDASKGKSITDKQVQILIDALQGRQPALSNFMNMPPSVRRTYTAFYLDAKKEETRMRRLEKIAERLDQNLKPM
jgi:uncharacterized protein YdeI (YjbR/CyaY-like superfamily)